MGYQTAGVQTGGLPIHLVQPLVGNYDIPFMVETGTANGDSARLAATLFKKVWTIEVVNGRADTETFPDNVTFYEGDSSKLIHNVIGDINKYNSEEKKEYVLFYLDAHYSDIVPNESDYPECPLLEEIRAVACYGESAIIIIDDARLFFGSPPYPHDPTQWPSICTIFHILKEKFKYHHITITDDYILAIPIHLKQAIDEEWRSRFNVRYPNAEDKLRSQVKDVHAAFMDKIYKPFLDYIK